MLQLIKSDPVTDEQLANDREYTEAMAAEDWDSLGSAMRRVIGERLGPGSVAAEELHWGGYFAVDSESGEVVGSCAFKTPPTSDGAVEIAYFTYPGFEGRGYATEMARRLVELARGSTEVRRVIAHTLQEAGPSTRALEKIGMTFGGEVIDPEDGPVWRWYVDVTSR